MKRLVIILVIIFTCGCSNQKQLTIEQVINNENRANNEKVAGDAKDISEKNSNKSNRILLDLKDPLLYVKNMNEEDPYSWRSREIQYSGSVEAISKEYLCSTIWNASSYDTNTLGVFLAFYLDDEFRMGTLQGGIELGGKYEVLDDGKVKLSDVVYVYNEQDSDTASNDILTKIFSGEEWILNFEVNLENFWYADNLYGDNQDKGLFFGATGSEPPFGEVYIINGNKIVKEEWKAVNTERVELKKEPVAGAETKKIGFVYQYDIENILQLDYLLKGAVFTVIGKSEEKSIVDGNESYWYYIRYHDWEFPTYGWVFGEYIEAYDENRAAEYTQIYKKEVESIQK